MDTSILLYVCVQKRNICAVVILVGDGGIVRTVEPENDES